MRNKPDYWYRQSAVIPFRLVGKKIEVLIITTRKKKKWIIPKGIIEEGLTSRESAIKEAVEEAGISGKMVTERLGKYTYHKWGGKCKVKVYAMEVETIFETWEEDDRERKWIEISECDKYISSIKIKEIIKSLKKNG